jgi:RNA polymerase sigma factor (sigma-70 family)
MTAEIEHIRVVQHLANRYLWATKRASGFDLEDLMQIGRMAVDRAERTWNPNRGAALSSHVFRVVKNALHQAANNHCSVVRLPHTQLAKRTRRPLILEGDRTTVTGSTGDWDEPPLWDVLGVVSDDPESDPLTRDRVRVTLAKLPERWAYILEQIHVYERLPQDIADELGISRQRVKQLENKGLAAFRAAWLEEK